MIKINGKTKLVGIFGWPVEHTFSPMMHNAAFSHLNLNFAYLPFAVQPSQLGDAVNSVRALNLVGVNVTVPHKENVIRYLDEIDELAYKIGSVNTIYNRNGKLKGFNTDGYGFLLSLKKRKIQIRNKKIFLTGAGGAAKAVAAVISDEKPAEFFIYDIDIPKAQKLSKQFNGISVNKDEIPEILKETDLIINATPVGMSPDDDVPIVLRNIKKTLIVYDLIYNRKTKLLKTAETLGLKTCGGLDMLLYQGARAFEIWTGKKAPINVMRKTLMRQISAKA